ncbi:cupin domain-containing protein [Roseateles sp. SL47]|jgi:quercetin dioxygenase-like cupin family protein|uniref:cupin domain-containing protein n=1 Tax=Roseateles sp. SL47 TaxID=2995138 RepID=UPI0022720A7D|nr:cupin domain-containing protein [Roseateles sp. SL47]WAC75220.1 cupin domain-containing protein [Roseateles sp. SL47]
MALPHAAPAQPIDIAPLGPALTQTLSTALFKSEGLEVMRIVLPAGKTLPAHKVDGEMTFQVIEGEVELLVSHGNTEDRERLHAGQLCYLPGGVVHTVSALQDASALLTIVLRHPD